MTLDLRPSRRILLGLAALGLLWPAHQGALAQANATFNYDVHGRLVSVIYPSGVQTTYSYDAANNRASVQVTNGAPPPPANQAPSCANKSMNIGAIPNGGVGVSLIVQPITVSPACTDPDGDALTLVSVTGFTNAATGTVSGANATISNVKAPGTTFTYTVSDGHGHTIYPTFTIARTS
ncbi:Ig-like domain-containing protein [Caulobacter sp. LARHSG274]